MIQISYPLSKNTPLYPNSLPVTFTLLRSLESGDSSNQSSLNFSNHAGTHIDMPLHFCRHGLSVADLLKPENTFFPAYCLDIPLRTGTVLNPELVREHLEVISGAQALLIRTGMWQSRDTPDYTSDYPWIHPDLPDFLRESLPGLRVFGIDTLSVANPSHREEGRQCHRNFLCSEPTIMILEDLNLSGDNLTGRPWILRVYPWILDAIDAVPVIAMLE